jgi:hypothetical protein
LQLLMFEAFDKTVHVSTLSDLIFWEDAKFP